MVWIFAAVALFPIPAAATISMVGTPTTAASSGTSIALTLPTGTQEGDLLVAHIAWRSTSTLTPPANWVQIGTTVATTGTGMQSTAWYRVAGAAEPAPTWTLSATQRYSGIVMAFRGAEHTFPIGASGAQANAASTTITAPSITTTVPNVTLVGFFVAETSQTTTTTTNMTQQASTNSGGGPGGISAAAGTGTWIGPSSTDVRTGTGGAVANIGHLFAVKPRNVQFSASTSSALESAGTANIPVTLSTAPATGTTATVDYAVTGGTATGSGTDYTLAAGTLTFNAGVTSQNVVITITADQVDEVDETVILTLSNPSANLILGNRTTHTFTITDDDTANVIVTETNGGTSVTEPSGTDTFTVVLATQPATGVVVVSLTAGDLTEATVSPATFTFGAANWSTPQTATVTAVDDLIQDGNIQSTITISVVDLLSSDEYDAVTDKTVTVTTVDNDGIGFTVTESGGTTNVSESGTTDTFTVVLNSLPLGNVVIDVSSNDTGEATVSPSSLTFGTLNWSSTQTVTVTGVNDDLDDGDQNSTITLTIRDSASSDEYDNVADQNVNVTTTDDDTAALVVVESDGSTSVDESATTDTFTVRLATQPLSGTVVVDVTSGDTGEATVSPASLTFGSGNWSTTQTVTVTGVDDQLVDGSQLTTVTIAVRDADSSDEYDAVADATVTVTTTDNDAAGFTIVESDGTTSVAESATTDSFTVALNATPASDVVLSLTSNDTGEATVTPPTLTFGPGNWSTPQTATVTGVGDDFDDGDQASSITVSVVDAASSNEYDNVPDQNVTVTTTDDDTAGLSIVQSGGSTTVSEAGTTDTFTVALATNPLSGTVLVTLTSNDTGEATVAPASLTFGAGNWSTPQTATVTGIDDAAADGDQNSTITASVVDAASSDEYDGVADQTVTVTTTDNDVVGFTIVESGGTTAVNESGTTDTFTAVLNTQPASGDVVLSFTSNDTGEATVSPPTLTFGAGNWSTPQAVTVTGVDDAADDGDQISTVTASVVDAASSDEYDSVADQVVNVTTRDDDTAGFTVVESDGTTTVSEGGTTDTFTVVLTSQPLAGTVVLTVSSNDTGEATVSPPTLTFGAGNWSSTQTVTVTGVNDDLDDGDQTSTITVAVAAAASSDEYDVVASQTVSATTTDNDAAGITVVESGGNTSVAETATTDTFTVALNTQPLSGTVVLTVTSNDTGEAAVSPPTLTFGAGNWSTPQTVTVTGVDDAADDGDQASTITIAVVTAASSDEYDGVSSQTVTVTTADNDTAGFTIAESDGTTSVTEAGGTDTFTVVLNTQPLAGLVVIGVASNDTGEATVSPPTLTFGSGNWSTPQTITVTGADDAFDDGDQASTITVSVVTAASSDEYDSVGAQTVTATTTDDDTAGITIVESAGSTTVGETGSTDTFTVALNTTPLSGTVVVSLTSNDTGEATVSPATLTFGAGNWSTPQTVTVTGVDDAVVDGDQNSTITVDVVDAASSDEYDGVVAQAVTVTTLDNDTAGFTLVESGGSTNVTEAGTTDTFTAVLNTQPLGDVVLAVSSNDTGEATVGPATLTFGPGNWSTPQTVTVTGVDDDMDDGDQTSTITVAVVTADSSDDYDAVAAQTVLAGTQDNDTAGFTIVESSGSTTVAEAGGTDTFTVRLDTRPMGATVVLTIDSNDTGEATVSPPTLTFGPANWSTPQTITVTGINDDLDDGDQASTITVAVSVAASSDEYDGVASQTVSATTTDDDTAGITIVESSGSTLVTEAGGTDTFTVQLDSQPLSGTVVVSMASNDTSESTASPATLTFGAANWSTPQTVTVTGVDDDMDDGNQTSTITVSVVDAASSDEYDAVADETVTATTSDGDTAGFTITPTGGQTTVTESGSTDTFTVVLLTQPVLGVVVLALTSNDTGEATVGPATLTFGAGNWSTPQVATVTGVDDLTADGDQNSTITVSVVAGASSDEYDAVASQDLTVTTTDNDVPGFTIVESGGSTQVSENGTTDTFTVVLNVQPAGNVVLSVASNDTGEATVSPATLTFGTANWSTPQVVTATGVNDDRDDGDQNSSITVAIVPADTSDEYDAVAAQTVTVTTGDEDTAGITIAESGGSTTVAESGTTDTFTIVLDTEPLAGTVVIAVSSNDTGEATVSPATLTFGTANWSTPQTITVTGVDDAVDDGDQTSTITASIVDAASSDEYDAVADETVTATTTDDDTAGITVTESGGTTVVSETGTTDNVTVVLDAQPMGTVLLSITSNDTGEATVAPATLTFGAGNWSTPQTVTITGADDSSADGNQTSTLTIAVVAGSSSDEYDAVAAETVSVTTTDDDTAGFTIAESDGTTSVTEAGATDTFTVVLDTQPASDVVLTISSNDTGEATVSPASLTFGPANWSTPQTVTATGVDDDVDDGDQSSTITVSIVDAASSDEYDSVVDQTVTATTTDDDAAGFTIVESGGSTTVSESGTTDNFTVVLDSQPLATVVLDVASNDTGEAAVAPSSLTFGPANWSTPQTVTVTGVDDAADDGDQNSTITVAVRDLASSDEYDGVADQTVTATTTDDDAVGFTVVQTDGSTTVSEAGTADNFTVVLDAQPLGTVVLAISSNDTGEAMVAPASLTFGAGNWSTPQTVTVTGVDDDADDGDQNSTITIGVVDIASSDEYDGVADQTVTVTTTDDDTAGFTIVESGGSTSVSEAATTDTFTVVLDTQPLSTVVLTVTSNDTGEATVAPATLTFGVGNWSTPQAVTVAGVDDDLDDGDQNSTITVSIADAASSDEYDGVADQTVTVTTTDDDTAGFTIVESGGTTTVSEAGATDTFTVVLNARPQADVVLTATSNDTGEATVSPATLTFGAGNWSSPQPVTVTGVDDDTDDGDQNSTITVAVLDAASSDEYDSVADQTVTATTTDDDAAGFTIVQTGGATSVSESGTTDTFTVVLDTQPLAGDVILSVGSNNTAEATVSPATLTFGAGNWSTPQTVAVTGVDDLAADGDQNSTITVSVVTGGSSDEYDAVAAQTVTVTTVDNDVPGITIVESGGTTIVAESGSTDTFTAVLNTAPASDVVLTVASNDTGEATVSPATLTFGPGNWSTPQTITVTGVDDDLDDGTQTSTITVAVVAAASSDEYDGVASQTVQAQTTDNDTAGITIVESDGSTTVSESGTTDTFTVRLDTRPLTGDVLVSLTSNDTGEASVAPATLTFGPGNWSTPQTATVTGVDDAAADGNQVSHITVSVVDAASSNEYDAVADRTVNVTTTDDDVPGLTVTQTNGTTVVTEAGATDDFTVVLDVQPLGNVVLTVASNDTGEATVAPSSLTFGPGNWSTPQTVTVTGVDDAADDGDQTSTITVAVLDAATSDEYDAVADQTVTATTTDDDTAGFTIAESGGSTAVSESGTTDTFTVVLDSEPLAGVVVVALASNDTGETTVAPATLTFGAANWSTPQTVTVTGVDDAVQDGDQASTITASIVAAASSDEYDAVAARTVNVTTADNDAAGFTIVQSDGATAVNETGTTDTFTVVLGSQPAADVVLSLSSNDTGEATVSPATLTFGPANWSSAQTATVTGVDDDVDDGDQNTTITVSIVDAASSDEYDDVADQTVSATTRDDDTAALVVAESGGSTAVAENGTTDTFTVALASQPASGSVVVTVTSNDTGEATVAPSTLTFGAANWSTPQTVTVTGVDDAVADGSQASTVTIAVADGESSDEYDDVPSQTVAVTTADDDAAGLVVVESGGDTSVSESGTTDTFTVALASQPQTDVVLSITSNDTGEAAASPSSLTFGPANWSTPQTVTVTGVDDAAADGTQTSTITVAVVDAASSDEYDTVADSTVEVTTADDDTAGIVVAQTGNVTTVTEAGATDTFTVALTAQPAGTVRITVTSNDTGEAIVAPASLTFGPGNWSAPQTVTATGVNDDVDDGDQNSTITLSVDDASSSDDYDGIADQAITVTTADDDAAGITVTITNGDTTVSETGTSDSFTVALTSEPASGTVVVALTSNDTGEATASPATLTFGAANWSTPQTVTVTGVDDVVADGNQPVTITVSVVDGASSGEYAAVANATVAVTNVDNDAPGFTINVSGGSTQVNESGTTDTVTVVLASEPAGDVLLAVSSNDTGEATAAPATLTFGAGNWSTPQTVTVTGVDDAVDDGDQNVTITFSIVDAASSDEYDDVADQAITATTGDDDTAGFTILESGGTTAVNETGTTDTFTVALTSQPVTSVRLIVSSNDTGEATASPATLTFGAANWSTPQTVTVTGVDDDAVDGSQAVLVTVSVDDTGSSAEYGSVPDQTVAVTTTDDDVAALVVVESGGSTTVSEAGTTDTFTVALAAAPMGTVVVGVSSADTGEASVSPATLTFGPANWSTPQTVTVSGVDDAVDDGDQNTTITISIVDAASSDEYDGAADVTITATTLDDDGAGFTIVESGGTTQVSESGTTDTFTVALTVEPSGTVVLNVTSNDTGEATVSPATLTFGPGNWSTAQTVTVAGVDDATIDGTQVAGATVSVDAARSADEFDAVAAQTVHVSVTDDDAAAIVLAHTNGTTATNESTSTDNVTVVLTHAPSGDVVVNITSNDTGEAAVSPATLTFGPANWSTPQTILVTGVDDLVRDGDQPFTITAGVDAARSSDDYDAAVAQTVAGTNGDNDNDPAILIYHQHGDALPANGTMTVVVPTDDPSLAVNLTRIVIAVDAATGVPVVVEAHVRTALPSGVPTPTNITVTGQIWELSFQADNGTTLTFSNATIRFFTSYSWLNGTVGTANALRVFHWNGTAWDVLVPVLVAENATGRFHEVTVSSFSPFMVGAVSAPAAAGGGGGGGGGGVAPPTSTVGPPPTTGPPATGGLPPIQGPDPLVGPPLLGPVAGPAAAYWMYLILGAALVGGGLAAAVHYDVGPRTILLGRAMAQQARLGARSSWQALARAAQRDTGRLEELAFELERARPRRLRPELLTDETLRINRLLRQVQARRLAGHVDPDLEVRLRREAEQLNQLFAQARRRRLEAEPGVLAQVRKMPQTRLGPRPSVDRVRQAATENALRVDRLLRQMREAQRMGLSQDPRVREAALAEAAKLNRLFQEFRVAQRKRRLEREAGPASAAAPDLEREEVAVAVVGAPSGELHRAAREGAMRVNEVLGQLRQARQAGGPEADDLRQRATRQARDLTGVLAALRERRRDEIPLGRSTAGPPPAPRAPPSRAAAPPAEALQAPPETTPRREEGEPAAQEAETPPRARPAPAKKAPEGEEETFEVRQMGRLVSDDVVRATHHLAEGIEAEKETVEIRQLRGAHGPMATRLNGEAEPRKKVRTRPVRARAPSRRPRAKRPPGQAPDPPTTRPPKARRPRPRATSPSLTLGSKAPSPKAQTGSTKRPSSPARKRTTPSPPGDSTSPAGPAPSRTARTPRRSRGTDGRTGKAKKANRKDKAD